jgi:hypothetical protein
MKLFLLVFLSTGSVLTDFCGAVSTMPGEGQRSFFHAITHLHPVAYLILFCVAVLSLVNLVAQGLIPKKVWPFSRIAALPPKMPSKRRSGSAGRGLEGSRRDLPAKAKLDKTGRHLRSQEPEKEGIVGVRRVTKVSAREMEANIPTPMEGINHPLPQFVTTGEAQTGTPRILERESDQKQASSEFKFSSAVDVLSQEETERREKEKLVVAGTAQGPDGRGIAAVMVYLTDQAGNRVGQSSRTARETGEFKVLVNEPGRYALNGYKRGFIMESSEPLILPIESGKIEGFNFRMIPEGCLVHGRVLIEGGGGETSDLEVRCLCANGAFSRSDRTDSAGEFRISGVPLTSKCLIEVCGTDGAVMARSAPFETLHKKEIYRKVAVSHVSYSQQTSNIASESAAEWDNGKGEQSDPSSNFSSTGSITQT